MALITPSVHVHRREEKAESGAHHEPISSLDRVGQAESRRKVQGAGKHQSFGHAGLSTNESGWNSIHEFQVAAPFVRPNVIERAHVFIAQAEVNGSRPRNSPVILNEGVAIPLPEVHVRDARLPLLDDGQAQKETCQRGASAVVRSRLGRKTFGELVEAAVLEEPPHGPEKSPVIAPDFQGVAAHLAAPNVLPLEHRVPVLDGRRGEGVPDAVVALQGEPRHPPRPPASKPHALNPQFRDVIMREVVLGIPMHGKARDP